MEEHIVYLHNASCFRLWRASGAWFKYIYRQELGGPYTGDWVITISGLTNFCLVVATGLGKLTSSVVLPYWKTSKLNFKMTLTVSHVNLYWKKLQIQPCTWTNFYQFEKMVKIAFFVSLPVELIVYLFILQNNGSGSECQIQGTKSAAYGSTKYYQPNLIPQLTLSTLPHLTSGRRGWEFGAYVICYLALWIRGSDSARKQ